MIGWDTPLTDFPGIGKARAGKLAKLGLTKAGNLMCYYPRTYEDRTRVSSIAKAPEGIPVCVEGIVAETPRLSRIRKGLDITRVKVVDESAAMTVSFFNQSYLHNALHPGETYIFYGTVTRSGRSFAMTNPVIEPAGRGQTTGRILPVYPLTAGISNNLIAGLVREALPGCLSAVEETLPEEVRQAHELTDMESALRHIHFPEDFERLAAASRRLAFEELLTLSLGLALLRQRKEGLSAPRCMADAKGFSALLPFAMTGAQKRAVEEICRDLRSGRPMNRLVQGDVGSGKTAVAAAAAYVVCRSGWQTAMMAPTEILAEQHYRSLSQMLAPAGIRVGLLTGSLKPSEKRKMQEAVAAGEIDFVVGTHALLSEKVHFARLGLIITDEQHRFGVEQRAALAAKANTPNTPPRAGRRGSAAGQGDSLPLTANEMMGHPGAQLRVGEVEQRAALAAKANTPNPPPLAGSAPHVLVMSATPIPRTLALIVYGDLDLSVLDELPPGRTPVETYLIGEDKRARMYGFVRKLVSEGRQAYLVCPAVEEKEAEDGETPAMDLKAVTQYAQVLKEKVFPDLRVEFLHGKMKPFEKENIMARFAAGDIDVLVATTVIEVGVDVPNAALMVIENAERFGLSQLHQLRGRVGRGKHQSYCVLVSGTKNPDSRARLKTLCATTDGFRIAEEDLKLRGPGDFFGARQHGLPTLHAADLSVDMRLLKEAQETAEELLSRDPLLKKPDHAALRRQVVRMFEETGGKLN